MRLRFAPDLRKCMGENKNVLRLSQIVCVLIQKSVFTLSVDFVAVFSLVFRVTGKSVF